MRSFCRLLLTGPLVYLVQSIDKVTRLVEIGVAGVVAAFGSFRVNCAGRKHRTHSIVL